MTCNYIHSILIVVFWVMTPYILLGDYQDFGGTDCHLP